MGAVATLHSAEQLPTDEEVIGLWTLHMQAAGCARRTVRERGILLRSYARYIGVPIISATRYNLISFLAQERLSPKTKQNYRSCLHTVYTLLQDEKWRADNPAARLPRGKVARTEADPFSTAEVQHLIDTTTHRRTRMMILLAAYQGFRAVEVAAASGAHVDWEERRILTVDGKGGVEVWRPMHPIVWEFAQQFPRDTWWFPGQRTERGHIAAKSVSNTLATALKRAEIRGHRPHQLRAWFATELVESGADLLTVQHAMRHATAGTLKHYVRPSTTNMREAMGRLPEVAIPTSKSKHPLTGAVA